MTGIQFAPRLVGAAAAPEPTPAGDSTTPPELTAEQKAFAEAHPAGRVDVERTGAKNATRWIGGIAGVAGAAIAGIGALRGGGAIPLAIGGLLAAGGIGTALIGPSLISDTKRVVVASNFTTRTEAQLLANSMVGRRIDVVEQKDGRWAIADMGPVQTSGPNPYPGGYPGGYSDYYPYDPHWGHDHYGHDHHYNPYPQYYPGFPDYGWNYDPTYPTPYGGSTSPGDDW